MPDNPKKPVIQPPSNWSEDAKEAFLRNQGALPPKLWNAEIPGAFPMVGPTPIPSAEDIQPIIKPTTLGGLPEDPLAQLAKSAQEGDLAREAYLRTQRMVPTPPVPIKNVVLEEPTDAMSHGSPTDTATYTFLDYVGLGLILAGAEGPASRWISDEPISSHTWITAAAALLSGFVVLAISKRLKTMTGPKSQLRESLDALAKNAWAWIIVFAAIIFGIPLLSSYVSRPSPTAIPSAPVLTLAPDPPPRPNPQFLKNIAFGVDDGPSMPTRFGATSTVTVERLRVFVDYSSYRNGWMPKIRAPIG